MKAEQLDLGLTRRGKPLRKLPDPLEFVLQKSVAAHLDWRLAPGWKWTHYPSGEDRDPRVGAKLSVMGTKPGWPDCMLVRPDGVLHSLELKRPSEFRTKNNGMSKAQLEWRDHCLKMGWPWAITDNVDSAVEICRGWGAIR